MIVLVVYGLSILSLIVVFLWFAFPAAYGLPLITTRPERIRKALKLANLQPGEVLYDLGAGDGRVLIIAARDFGARAIGIEIGPLQCVWIWLVVAAGRRRSKIQVRRENFYKTNLHDADVVFVYATSKEVVKLAPHLEQQMKKGARLVSISADFPEWEPAVMDDHDLIFVYGMPPTQGSIASYLMKNTR